MILILAGLVWVAMVAAVWLYIDIMFFLYKRKQRRAVKKLTDGGQE